jgi:hypothetical protein
MTVTTTIRTFLALCASTCVLASSAVAAGEPKNELPFTRAIGIERAATAVTAARHHSSLTVDGGLGEAKNQLPFTRR